MADSIARQFARWAAKLTYEDLPPEVVDKLKALILLPLVSSVFGAQVARARETIELVKAEEPKPDGATILWDGAKATRIGATFANSELMHASGLIDSYRMITHPGSALVAAALANAELGRKAPKEMITALAAGYEFACRLAYDFVPSTSARGYRPAPIFHTMGAAMTAAKVMDLDEDALVAAIAIAANCAGGLNEAGRTGGGEQALQDPNAARQGVFAAVMARTGHVKGSEQIIEGDAGFLNAFTGSSKGRLTYAFTGPLQIDLDSITAGLGSTYKLRTVMFRMYGTAGFNQPVIDLMSEMKRQHNLSTDDIEHVFVRMNYLETLYPSPAFPRSLENPPAVGSTHYFAAHAAVNGGYPQVGGRTYGPAGVPLDQDQKVFAFMQGRVSVVGEHRRPMFSPAIMVRMKNGTMHAGEYPYGRMEWNFDQLLERLDDCASTFPLGRAGYDTLVQTVRNAEQLTSVNRLFELTRPK